MLTTQELQIVLDHVSNGMGLRQAIQSVGKELDDKMRDWFIGNNPSSPELTQQHLAYIAVKKGGLA
jgi:hypothetical protein